MRSETSHESEQSSHDTEKLIWKLSKKVLGIKTPGLDLMLRASDVVNGDCTIGEAALDTAISCNGYTAALELLGKLGTFSAKNNFSKKLFAKSHEKAKAINHIDQMESTANWRAASLLATLEGIAYGVTAIKDFIATQITETVTIGSQMIQLDHLLNDLFSKMIFNGVVHANRNDANKKLFDSAKNNDQSAIEMALHFGADINAQDADSYGHSALQHAVERGHLETAIFLMDRDANPHQKNNNPIQAISAREAASVLQQHAHIKRVHDFFELQDGNLLNAAHFGDFTGVDIALKYGADINAKNVGYTGYTALMHALGRGHAAIANFLIDCDVEIHTEDTTPHGKTPLRLSVENGHLELAQRLMDLGANPLERNRDSLHARDCARIVYHGGGVQAKRAHDFFEAQDTALLNAAYLGDLSGIRAALKYGANINVQNPHPSCRGRTPLHHAVHAGQYDAVKLLVEQGANIEAIDGYYQFRPVHWAAEIGRVDIFNLLVSLGADPRVKNQNSHSPFDIARILHPGTAIALSFLDPASCAVVAKCFKKLFTQSSAADTAVNSQPVAAPTPQSLSDRDRRLAIMNRTRDALAKRRAPIQALFDAAKNGNCDGIRNAIASGVPINSRDSYHGYTAIHWAVHYKQLDAYNLLCSFSGVDRHLANADGYTPFALACKLHSDVVFPVYIYAPQFDKDILRSQYPFHCSETPENVARFVIETHCDSNHEGGRRQTTGSVSGAGFFGSSNQSVGSSHVSGSHTPDPAVVAGIRAEIAAERAGNPTGRGTSSSGMSAKGFEHVRMGDLECLRTHGAITGVLGRTAPGEALRTDGQALGLYCRYVGSDASFTRHEGNRSVWAETHRSYNGGSYSYGDGRW